MMISLSLLQRTIVGIALLVGLLLLSIATGSLGLTQLQGMTRQLAEVEAAKVDHASQAALLLGQVDRELTQLLNREDSNAYARFTQVQPARRQAIGQHFAALERLTDDTQGRALLADVLSRRQQVLAALTQLTPLLDAGQFAEGRSQFDRAGLPAFSAYLAAVDRYLDWQKRRLAEHSQQANDTVAAFRLWLTLIGSASLLAALVIAIWLVRSVSRPLGGDPRVAGEALNRIAQGDLASQVPAGNAHPHSVLARLSGMRGSLRNLVGNIQGATGDVSQAARDLSSSCAQIAAGALEQGSSTASMAAAVEQLGSNIDTLAQSSRRVLEVAGRADTLASESDRMLGEAAGEIGKMIDTIDNSAQDVAALASKTSEIGRIVGVINDIADQTNLLALNASIEAARAGEQGRGFAVVADEVRKLAEHTTRATREIDQMIQSIQQQTRLAADNLLHGEQVVGFGVRLVRDLVSPLRQLREGAGETRRELDELMLALDEQTHATRHIGSHIERVASAAEEFGLAARQSAHTASTLLGVVNRLDGEVAHFRLQG
ncbi:hypothetical protein BXU06_11690 [Aquaspirillum sp. LM1]|uniref:methyl-accepting chemotaxis protein n=1 Tax=Aquaspirillum sp. LM1 TaxID=1938604 RepID=UPI000983E72B|nr:methyl-accepting chemotaxis protein [Aquaspirillum sp. LM1]AQR65638.1 hypothetical protein BXU06_11690 [Aquaspirillum sp. LM1]